MRDAVTKLWVIQDEYLKTALQSTRTPPQHRIMIFVHSIYVHPAPSPRPSTLSLIIVSVLSHADPADARLSVIRARLVKQSCWNTVAHLKRKRSEGRARARCLFKRRLIKACPTLEEAPSHPSPPLRPQWEQEPAATTNVTSRSLCHTVQQGERALAVGVGVAEAGAVG